MTNTNPNVIHLPQNGTPYSGLRKGGAHKRAYTVAALAVSGFLQWDRKGGTIIGFPKEGSMPMLSSMLGNTAYSYWARTTGRVANGALTEAGIKEVTASLQGAGNLNTIPGLITAYLAAFETGILREPGTKEVLERFNASTAKPKQTAKPATTAKPTAKAKPKQTAKPTAKAKPKQTAKPTTAVNDLAPKAKV